jgi:hypothetical protein
LKRKCDAYKITLQKGKKQSEDDIKKRQQFISIKYWVGNPLEAVKDELTSGLCKDNKAGYSRFQVPAIATSFLADHGNIAWRAGLLTIIASKQDGES